MLRVLLQVLLVSFSGVRAAPYLQASQLPNVTFDFIIVGGGLFIMLPQWLNQGDESIVMSY